MKGDRGIALPSVVTLICVVAVAVAAVAFLLTRGDVSSSTVATPPPSQSPSPSVSTSPIAAVTVSTSPPPSKPKPKPVERGSVPVVVFNSTSTPGLAAAAGTRVAGRGWRLVSTANWRGTLPATTVYYPAKLEAAGKLLAKDLHIARIRPAEKGAMSAQRLTLILTAPLP